MRQSDLGNLGQGRAPASPVRTAVPAAGLAARRWTKDSQTVGAARRVAIAVALAVAQSRRIRLRAARCLSAAAVVLPRPPWSCRAESPGSDAAALRRLRVTRQGPWCTTGGPVRGRPRRRSILTAGSSRLGLPIGVRAHPRNSFCGLVLRVWPGVRLLLLLLPGLPVSVSASAFQVAPRSCCKCACFSRGLPAAVRRRLCPCIASSSGLCFWLSFVCSCSCCWRCLGLRAWHPHPCNCCSCCWPCRLWRYGQDCRQLAQKRRRVVPSWSASQRCW